MFRFIVSSVQLIFTFRVLQKTGDASSDGKNYVLLNITKVYFLMITDWFRLIY